MAICGGIVWEEALNLSLDRLLHDDDEDDDEVYVNCSGCGCFPFQCGNV